MRLRTPPAAREALSTLASALTPASRPGFRVLVVGGSVRDLVEGRLPREWDLVVLREGNGPGEKGVDASRLASALARRWRWREPVSFPRFGTYLVEGPAGRVELSDASLRTSLRLPHPDPLERDAHARDFTLNALYLDPLAGDGRGSFLVLDPTGKGLSDLASGLLRTPLPASRTLEDDPLRVLRAARFASTHGYRTVPAFSRAARAAAPRLRGLAVERVREELDRLLAGEHPGKGIALLARWGALEELLPEVHAMLGFAHQNPHHFPDLFTHVRKAVEATPPDPVIRWAALLHDTGKVHTRTLTPQGAKYHGHEKISGEVAERALRRLGYSRRRVRQVTALVRLHMINYQLEWTNAAVRRLASRAGEHLPALLALLEADSAALRRYGKNLAGARALRRRMEEVLARGGSFASPLDGGRIMELLEVGPGPEVGEAKDALREAAVAGGLKGGKAGAEAWLLRWWKGRGGRPRPPSPGSPRPRR